MERWVWFVARECRVASWDWRVESGEVEESWMYMSSVSEE
jgi:hypothetical protein